MIHLAPDCRDVFATEQSVEDFRCIPVQVARRFKNRYTGRFERGGRSFYIKYHGPMGWWAVLEDLLRFRIPSVGAAPEYQAIRQLEALGVPTMQVAAFGTEGRWWPWQRSFLVTHEIAPAIDLEKLAESWETRPPDPLFRRRLVGEVARLTRLMHQGGVNHRDLYICHFMLEIPQGLTAVEQALRLHPRLRVIDLHRAQIRAKVPFRWVVKDLAGLCFSSANAGLITRDLLWFSKCYAGLSLRTTLVQYKNVFGRVRRRAAILCARQRR